MKGIITQDINQKWIGPFAIDNLPNWTCPICDVGILIGNKKDFTIREAVASIKDRNNNDWDHEWLTETFVGYLTCNKCSDNIGIIGNMFYLYGEEWNTIKETWEQTLDHYLTPSLFSPTIHLFSIKNLPAKIREQTINAFKLYWIDDSSCANKIRLVVELIMDEQKVAKTYITSNGKRRQYTLHERIQLFESLNPIAAKRLMAIKWIGNYGSHATNKLSKENVIIGFHILENVMDIIYNKGSDKIDRIVTKINKRKKP